MVKNFDEIKQDFLFDIKGVVEMEPDLIFNWDQTGISIVPGSNWTMELKGSKRIEIVGIRQITAPFVGTFSDESLKTYSCQEVPSVWICFKG